MNKKIGPVIAAFCKRTGVKQAELSRLTGINPVSLNRFFKGDSDLRSSDFAAILEVLGVNIEEQLFAIESLNKDEIDLPDAVHWVMKVMPADAQQLFFEHLSWFAERYQSQLPAFVRKKLSESVSNKGKPLIRTH